MNLLPFSTTDDNLRSCWSLPPAQASPSCFAKRSTSGMVSQSELKFSIYCHFKWFRYCTSTNPSMLSLYEFEILIKWNCYIYFLVVAIYYLFYLFLCYCLFIYFINFFFINLFIYVFFCLFMFILIFIYFIICLFLYYVFISRKISDLFEKNLNIPSPLNLTVDTELTANRVTLRPWIKYSI